MALKISDNQGNVMVILPSDWSVLTATAALSGNATGEVYLAVEINGKIVTTIVSCDTTLKAALTDLQAEDPAALRFFQTFVAAQKKASFSQQVGSIAIDERAHYGCVLLNCGFWGGLAILDYVLDWETVVGAIMCGIDVVRVGYDCYQCFR